MTKKAAASSRPEKLVRKNSAGIKAWFKTPKAKADTKRLTASGPFASKESLADIPEITDEEWAALKAQRAKKAITTRLDGDIILWLKGKPGKYQRNMNAILREAMNREREAR